MPPIDALYAWVAREPSGDEGVAGAHIAGLGLVPLVGADIERVTSLRSYAEEIASATGVVIRLVRFSTREVLEELVQ